MLSPKKKPATKISKPVRRVGESESSFKNRMRVYNNATSRTNSPSSRARSSRELNVLTRSVGRNKKAGSRNKASGKTMAKPKRKY